MAAGLPVATSDTGAFRDYVPEECRFPLNDPSGLVALLDAIDGERLARWSAAGPVIAERFRPSMHVRAHHRLFARLVGSPNG
jgi:hypothetical protein